MQNVESRTEMMKEKRTAAVITVRHSSSHSGPAAGHSDRGQQPVRDGAVKV